MKGRKICALAALSTLFIGLGVSPAEAAGPVTDAGRDAGAYPIMVVATLRAKPGKGPELERAFSGIAVQVKAHEPGVPLYQLVRSRTEADTYKLVEIYLDAGSRAQHRVTSYYQAARGTLRDCIASTDPLEVFDAIR